MTQPTPPGWYQADGDPPGTQRYWDGAKWVGGPQPVSPVAGSGAAAVPGSAPMVGNYVLGSAGNRIVARIIDFFIALVPAGILLVIIGGGSWNVDVFNEPGKAFLSNLVFLALAAGYEVTMTALKGGTLGKKAMGLAVATDSGEMPVGWAPAVRRFLVFLVGLVPFIGGLVNFVVWIVSLVFLFSDNERRTIWDRIANTRVVSTKG